MVKVGLFFTGGHTEMGGLQAFLERAFEGVRFERCFPARDRRVPLRRRDVQPPPRQVDAARLAPQPADTGTTGAGLVKRMLDIIQKQHAPGEYRAYLLEDDADCRFCDAEEGASARWEAELSAQLVSEGKGPVFVLLARQEIESWLLADWESTFGAEFPALPPTVRRDLGRRLQLDPDEAWTDLEQCGCPRISSGCTTKISAEVQSFLGEVGASLPGVSYSKWVHGQAMLHRADPERVAARMPQFRADLRRIRAAIDGIRSSIGDRGTDRPA